MYSDMAPTCVTLPSLAVYGELTFHQVNHSGCRFCTIFTLVFTREDTSSLPVPETKFNGTEGERLGQLVITPEVIANKINNMTDNKSPGVDGIAPKILKETVEQISKPLAHVLNMSLQEGIVPLEWKEANIIPLFKKGSRNKSVNYRPVSLTSVICKLLESIIII